MSESEYKEKLSNLHQKDDNLSDIIIPKWLPKSIQEIICNQIEQAKSTQNKISRVKVFDVYKMHCNNIRKIYPAFVNDLEIINTWRKLYSLNAKNTLLFAERLFSIPIRWTTSQRLKKEKNAIKSLKALLPTLKRFENAIDIHLKKHSWPSIITPYSDEIKKIKVHIENCIQERQTEHANILIEKNPFIPITREYSSKTSAINFFAKCIYFHFLNYFKKSMHKETALFINAIFNVDYSAEQIAQITRTFKNKSM